MCYYIVNPDCPKWSLSTISFYLQGIDGPDSIHADGRATIRVLYPDTGLFFKFSAGAYNFSSDSSSEGGYVRVLACPPAAAFTAADTRVCAGHCIHFTDRSIKAKVWRWYFDGGMPSVYIGQQPPDICYTRPGRYSVSLVVQSRYGYDSVTQAGYIDVLPAPTPQSVAQSITIEQGDDATLSACALGDRYTWQPAIPSCIDCANPVFKPATSGRYSCVVATAAGCSDTCLYDITIHYTQCGTYIPNAYSPNGDGINDYFQTYSTCPVLYYQLQIFDRWGEQVYQTLDESARWDGTYKGIIQNGIFVYVLTVTYANEQTEHVKGSITVIR